MPRRGPITIAIVTLALLAACAPAPPATPLPAFVVRGTLPGSGAVILEGTGLSE